MHDHGTESVESRIVQLQDEYRQVVNEIRSTASVLRVTTTEVADCFRTAPEERTRRKRGNSVLDCFLRLYREISMCEVLDEKLGDVERRVRRMKAEVDALWVKDLMPAVADVAKAIKIESIRGNRDALMDAAQDVLAKVYERTLLECLLNWRGEGRGLFTDYLRASVANVKRTYERDLRERIKREDTIENLPEPADDHPHQAESDAIMTADVLIEMFVAAAGGGREADVFFLHQDGLTHAQIAKRLFISEEHSRVLLHRAILILRRCADLREEMP